MLRANALSTSLRKKEPRIAWGRTGIIRWGRGLLRLVL
jgi:hypothetical protein